MNKQELETALAKATKQLGFAKEADEKAFAEKKVNKLRAELEKLEADEAKQAALGDMKKGEKAGKTSSNNPKYKVGDNVEYHVPLLREVSTGEISKVTKVDYGNSVAIYTIDTFFNDKNQVHQVVQHQIIKKVSKKAEAKPEHKTIGAFHKLQKMSNDVYTIVNTKSDKAEFEIEKKSDGKWHVECLTKETHTFDSLDEAVNHVSKSLYKGEVKEAVDHKKKVAKKAAERRAKFPNGISAAATVKNTVEAVENKLDEKKEAGKSTEKDQEALVNQIVALIKLLDDKFVAKLMAALKK